MEELARYTVQENYMGRLYETVFDRICYHDEAISKYHCVAIGWGWKKRLLKNGKVIKKDWSATLSKK